MRKSLYLEKPFDGSAVMIPEECEFIKSMNQPTFSNTYLSVRNYTRIKESIPNGLPQYFFYNDVDIKPVYPLDDFVSSFEKIDFSIPVLAPFKYVNYFPEQQALLKFDKIIFLDKAVIERILRDPAMRQYAHKFFMLDDTDKGLPFLEYSTTPDMQFVEHYELSNKLIAALKSGDFSALKHR